MWQSLTFGQIASGKTPRNDPNQFIQRLINGYFMYKKIIVIFFLLTTAIFAQPEIPELKNYATDLTGTLSSQEVSSLSRQLQAFDDSTSTQIVFLMIPTLDDYPIEMFANETAEKNKIGTKENSNGVLFLVSKNDRKIRIEVGYGLEGALPDALAGSIIRNEVAPRFRSKNFREGIIAGLSAIILATKGEYTEKRKRHRDDDEGEGIGFPIYLIIFILLLIFGRGRGGGIIPLLILGGLGGRSSGGGFSGRGGGFGGGGFSGGGGSFGGGGASGGW